MKSWSPDSDDESFELTPMIDVVFLLIAFFMTVTTFASAELVKIEMPESQNSIIPENTDGRQFVSIDADGNYFLGSRPSNLEEIKATIERRVDNEGTNFRGVYIRGDAQTRHQLVNDLMEACAEAGAFNIVFGAIKD